MSSLLTVVWFVLSAGALCAAPKSASAITVDYPAAETLFPPEIPSPTFLWRDSSKGAVSWSMDIDFGDGAAPLHAVSRGERMKIGPIDRRCVSATNKLPVLTPEQAAAHTWTPAASVWTEIKKRSAGRWATLAIAGRDGAGNVVSRGMVRFETSTDPIGAPIFYRDVPLMPSETQQGVIKPLPQSIVPLIAWRLRDVGDTSSRVLMTGIHSCANCHSFSRDGQTMGMDVDGPHNDKGLYALVKVEPKMTIAQQNVVAWSTFRGKLGGKLRVGFMSQVSPTGDYVVTTINDPGEEQSEYERRKHPKDLVYNYYVANFKDYRFLQVFYPTRGVLAWYSREAGKLQPVPGADDTRYVHTNAVWSPDGRYLVFARAEAKDAYGPETKMAEYSNDPRETQMRYELYRMPFNGGKGGKAEPIAGASGNGMSNSFPKVSPDGKWIVYVQAKNGQLMRPDGRLFIVPAAGGEARLMKCNTRLMNSWHSFSPNGRWMVFSSKARSPYTQMYLTHIDENGNDSPPVLIENSTASNRAVNIPEFVSVPQGGMLQIDAPVTDYYRVVDVATELDKKGEYAAAAAEWQKAAQMNPAEAPTRLNLGVALSNLGRIDEAMGEWQKALDLSPDYPEAHNDLANALAGRGRLDEAIRHYEAAVRLSPDYAEAHNNLGNALAMSGNLAGAIGHFEAALAAQPDLAVAHNALGLALAMSGKPAEAIPHFELTVKGTSGRDPMILDLLSRAYAETGRVVEALKAERAALAIARAQRNQKMAAELEQRIAEYEKRSR